MKYQQLLQSIVGVMLFILFLVGCSFEAIPSSDTPAASKQEQPIATLTPVPPTDTPVAMPTPIPPTDTPAPSLTEFGQAEEFGDWKMKVVNVDQADNISTSGRGQGYRALEGHTIYLVELELENTADAASTLEVDPQKIEVLDSDGKNYMSIGGAPVGSTFVVHIFHTGGSSSMKIEPASGGPAVTLTSEASDENTKKWTIELASKGPAKLTMAFVVPSDAQIKELHWPELPPYSLEQ